jgi:hypothetical protein
MADGSYGCVGNVEFWVLSFELNGKVSGSRFQVSGLLVGALNDEF